MAYVPDPTDPTQPVDTVDISTAAAEFRALKLALNKLFAPQTFNAVVTPSTSGTVTTSSATIKYIKVFNLVFYTGTLVVSSVSSPVGACDITGFPYGPPAGIFNRSSFAVHAASLAAGATTAIQAKFTEDGTSLRISKFAAGADADLAANIQAGTTFTISGFVVLA